jgi:hypothetical protein
MTVSTTIDSTLGVVTTADASNASIPGVVTVSGLQLPLTVVATGSTLSPSQAGVLTIAGAEVSALVMPLAASCAGSVFAIRTATAKAHFLTCSQEGAGTKAFTDGTSAGQGSKLTLANVIGSSVALFSDGKNFLVIGNSGSVTITGT